MYRTAFQRGFLTVFFSGGSKPLDMWEVHVQNGHIARFLDPDIKSMVLDIRGTNVSTSYMLCPSNNRILGITMPFLIMVVKNLKKYFTFEVTIRDDTGARRRFRVANFQSTTQILPMTTVMPIGLADGWNQIQFNLSEFTRRAYNKSFVEVEKIKVNANIRLRRIYFAERLPAEEDLPAEYRIFLPLHKENKLRKSLTALSGGRSKVNISKTASQHIITSQSKLKTTSATSIVQIPQSVILNEAGRSGAEKEAGPSGGEKEAGPSGGVKGVGPSGGENEAAPSGGEKEAGPSGGEKEAVTDEAVIGEDKETPEVVEPFPKNDEVSPQADEEPPRIGDADEALHTIETTTSEDEAKARLKTIPEEVENEQTASAAAES